jgi:hypothetical protein
MAWTAACFEGYGHRTKTPCLRQAFLNRHDDLRLKLDGATCVAYNRVMQITTGKVVGGQIVVEGEPLSEGSNVIILVHDTGTFTLSGKDDAALLEALAEADRGDMR